MPNEEKSVLDEMNTALEDIGSPEPDETVDTEGEGVDETEVAEGEEKIAEGEEEVVEGEEPEGEPEPEKGPNGERERNPDGTWKKAEPKKEEPPKKDPINDPIPENLKKDTSERIRSLIDTAKTVTAERDQLRTDFDYMVKGVQATNTTPEQYGETLSWLSLFNSGDPAQQEKALELVESVADRLATLLGKERTVGDPLAAHADLKDAVAKGQITAQYAKEIARTRNGQQFRTELTNTVSQQEQQRQAAAQEETQARSDLSALEAELTASDPLYPQKKAALVPALQPLFKADAQGNRVVRPSLWKAKFMEAYRNVQVQAPAAPARAKVPANQPLRAGKQPAGGQTRQPSSMLEAISGALGSMGK